MRYRLVVLSCFTGLLIGVSSCASHKGIPGTYSAKGKDYKIVLVLQSDSSFRIEYETFEVHKHGKGSWRVRHPDTLVLTCKDYSNLGVFGGITQDYMEGDVLYLSIKKRGRFQYFKAILKRNKSAL